MKAKLLLCCSLLSCVLLVACGVSKSDYEDLEKRVSKLEKQLNGEVESDGSGKQVYTPTTTVKNQNAQVVYDLSSLTTDEIVTDFIRFLTPNMAGKTPEQFVEGLNLRYYPNNQTDNSVYLQDNVYGAFSYFEGNGDYMGSLDYSYSKSMDNMLEKASCVRTFFKIVDYQRAEQIFDRLAAKFFSEDRVKKEGTRWRAEKDNSYIVMERKNNAYSFTIQLYFDR